EIVARVHRLAHVLTHLGIKQGDRVATLAWNNDRHVELYFAAPCTGAVLHTLNLRLSPDQLAYIANDAGDSVIFVDESLVPMLHANAWGIPYAAGMAGSTLILPDRWMGDPEAMIELATREKATFLAGVPTIWIGALQKLAGRKLPHVRAVFCGGSAVPRSLM